MKKLITSAVLTLAAVPFLVAAPSAQNQSASAPATVKPKVQKKHVRKAAKSQGAVPNSNSTAPSPAN